MTIWGLGFSNNIKIALIYAVNFLNLFDNYNLHHIYVIAESRM